MKYKILQIFRLILKIINKPSSAFFYFELLKISRVKRYKKLHTKLLGNDMILTDSKSF